MALEPIVLCWLRLTWVKDKSDLHKADSLSLKNEPLRIHIGSTREQKQSHIIGLSYSVEILEN